jgi:hypothetical protein
MRMAANMRMIRIFAAIRIFATGNMKHLLLLFPVCSLIAISCSQAESKNASHRIDQKDLTCASCRFNYLWMDSSAYEKSSSVCARFPVPENFVRIDVSGGSFGEWLRGLPLLPEGTEVHLFDGELKINQGAQAAVLDIDVGKRDLQQCADACMRLRAEYLFATKQYDKIAFNYTSGDRVDYKRWIQGRRIVASGNKTREVWTGKKYVNAGDHAAFRIYMDDIFNYAGTLSLSRELKTIPTDSLQPGDLFIHGGSPGHAVLVVDMAVNPKTGEKLFMIAQSYMPAQQPHILRNPEKGASPWYPLNFGSRLITPEYEFEREEVKRF